MEKLHLKVGLVSSTGGHLTQLKQLFGIVNKFQYFLVTEKSQASLSYKEKQITYYLNQQERKNFFFLWIFFTNIMRSIVIVLKEKPDVMISTGAGACVPICFFAKIFGAKVVYIESFAKIHSPTITGKIIYHFADKFYIQWEELKVYYPKAEYRGPIY